MEPSFLFFLFLLFYFTYDLENINVIPRKDLFVKQVFVMHSQVLGTSWIPRPTFKNMQDLVTLFNGISTFVGYLMPKTSS